MKHLPVLVTLLLTVVAFVSILGMIAILWGFEPCDPAGQVVDDVPVAHADNGVLFTT